MARTILAASLLIALAGTQQPALAENDVDRFPQDVGAILSSAAAPAAEAEPVAEAAQAGLTAVPLPPTRPAALRSKLAARASKAVAVARSAAEDAADDQQTEVAAADPAEAAATQPTFYQAALSLPAIAQPAFAPLAAAQAATPLSKDDVAQTTRAARIAVASRAGPAAIHDLIAMHAAQQGVPLSLADAVVRIESRYNPAARNGPYMGLTQIAHRTAQSLGYAGDASGLLDPAVNLRYGMRYLAQAYKLAGGDTCRTVMKYQSGHRAVSMTAANRIYCAKVRTIVGSAN